VLLTCETDAGLRRATVSAAEIAEGGRGARFPDVFAAWLRVRMEPVAIARPASGDDREPTEKPRPPQSRHRSHPAFLMVARGRSIGNRAGDSEGTISA